MIKKYCQKLKDHAEKFSFYDPNNPPIEKTVKFILKVINGG